MSGMHQARGHAPGRRRGHRLTILPKFHFKPKWPRVRASNRIVATGYPVIQSSILSLQTTHQPSLLIYPLLTLAPLATHSHSFPKALHSHTPPIIIMADSPVRAVKDIQVWGHRGASAFLPENT